MHNHIAVGENKNLRTTLTVVFTVICIVYMMPIVMVLYNSLKSNSAINTSAFALPNSQTFMGFKNYVNGMTAGNYPFLASAGYSLYITIPSVMPSVTICTFLTLTNSFKLFDQNMALNGGEPIIRIAGTKVKTTEMLALNIYNTFYGSSTVARGVGQAKAVLFFILVAVIALAQLRLTRDKEVQR